MKRLILALLLLLSITANAQQKRHAFIGWYSYLISSNARQLYWERLDDVYLFPDSTVKATVYTDSSSSFDYVNLHTVGQAFASNSFIYVDPLPLPYFCKYKIDTVGFYYRYNHIIENSVDTLRVQFFQNEQVLRNQLDSPWYAYVPYDTNTGLASQTEATYTVDVLLDNSYHTGLNLSDTQFLQITIPGDGLRIKQKSGAAFIATFIPGYNYGMGDTLQANYTPPPTKQLNGFLPLLYRDTTKYYDTSANNGLFAFSELKYNLKGDDSGFITPGNLGNESNWVLDAKFHVTENICGPDNVEKVNQLDFNIYPNPANNSLNIISSKYQNYTVTITDVLGKVYLKTTEQTINTSTLANGVYYAHITLSDGRNINLPIVISH